jgi:hypothetical protein
VDRNRRDAGRLARISSHRAAPIAGALGLSPDVHGFRGRLTGSHASSA